MSKLKDTLVLVHPGWPWVNADESNANDRRRLRRYEGILRYAMSAYRDIVLVGDIQADCPPLLNRLRGYASCIVTTFQPAYETDFHKEAEMVRDLALPSIVVGGFYRNLCVKQFCEQLKKLDVPYRIDSTTTAGRLVY